MEQKPDPILQFFKYSHLPEPLQSVSRPFCDLAHRIVGVDAGGATIAEGGDAGVRFPLPRSPERTVALRKLLEAKDAAVRAHIFKEG